MAGHKLEADPYRDKNGIYSLEIEWKKKWNSLSDEQQAIHIAYLKGMYYFITDPGSISFIQKKWLLSHADIETDIIPLHYHRKYSLSSELPESESVA